MNKGFRIEKRRIGKAVVYMVLILLALYTLFPLLILVINSFKPHTDIIANPLAWPRPVDIGFVIKALRELKFTQSFFVTLFITTISILMIVMASSLAAWAMIRNKTVYSKLVFYIFIAAMLVPFQAVMFPLLNVFEKKGIKNIWGLVIMYGGFGMSMSIFLYHGFMKSVPVSLEEAAVLDGAGAIQIFLKVVFPLVKGTTSTVIILNALWICKKGTGFETKKSKAAKEKIRIHCKAFGGTLDDVECMKLTGLARNTYYKYKRQIRAGLVDEGKT